MKSCPYCGAENRDTAEVCYACGNRLGTVLYAPPPADEVSRTQPLHRRSAAGSQPPQPVYPPPDYNADPWGQQSPPEGSYPQQPGYTQPGYGQQPAYGPGVYYPPQPVAPKSHNRLYTALLVGAGLVMLCACSLATLTFFSATMRTRLLGAGLSTQVAEVVSQPTETAPAPVVVVEPTPWPTFTPEAAQPAPVPTTAPDPAQPAPGNPTDSEGGLEKLLTPECAAALDTLQAAGEEATNNPAAPLDEEWRRKFSQSLDDMRAYCGSLDTASPVPGQLGEAQRNLKQASDTFDQANQLFKEGVETWSPGKLLEAGKKVGEALNYLNQAIKGLREIGN